jgi:hypothetical protein
VRHAPLSPPSLPAPVPVNLPDPFSDEETLAGITNINGLLAFTLNQWAL